MRIAIRTFTSSVLSRLTAFTAIVVGLGYLPDNATAKDLSAYLELDYTRSDATSRNATGDTVKSQGETLAQRYNISLNKSLLPTLRLTASGIFEKNTDLKGDFSTTTIRPAVDLFYFSPVFNAAAGYGRTEISENGGGQTLPAQISEDYHLLFSWKPVDLPTVNLQLSRNNAYDATRTTTDSTTDRLSLTMGYTAIKSLNIGYSGAYQIATDHLNSLEVQDLTNSGRISYGTQLFNNRVTVQANYNVSQRHTKTTTSGQGEVATQAFPQTGLFALNDIPETGTLDPLPSLIDGNLATSAGINIGVVPLGSPPQQATRRNMGADFFTPPTINRIFVWVDRRLPTVIANAFSWEVFTSSDNLNWASVQTAAPGEFDLFLNRFQIDIPNVTARYVKVVVSPLSSFDAGLAPDFANPDKIFITETQFFLRQPAEDVKGTSDTSSHFINGSVRTQILQTPALYHDLSFSYAITQPSSVSSWTLTNSLALNHRFNDIFSGNARVGREDSDSFATQKTAYVYSASLRAVPLPTLINTLLYAGRKESGTGSTTSSDTVTLFTTAELYKGVSVNVSGGVSIASSDTELTPLSTTKSANIRFGTSIVPRDDLTFNFYYLFQNSTTSGGGQEPSSNSNQRLDVGATYRPFATLFLAASYSVNATNTKTDTLANYGINWSPFPGGALQFHFAYNESLRLEDNSKQSSLVQGATWQITPRASLETSYSIQNSKSLTATSDANILSVLFRLSI